ncbi:MAG: transcriptional regulator [Syntrophorhabdaceae bacterium]
MQERSKKKKVVREAEPVERYETLRHYIAALLEEGTYTAKELSGIIKIPEKDVCEHIEHLQHSLGKTDRRLVMISASCRHCDFVFKRRERLTKPGKCPSCRSIHIQPPLFHIERY